MKKVTYQGLFFSLVLHLHKKMLLLNHEKQTSQTKTPLIALSGVFLYFRY